MADPDQIAFRHALGHFASGVGVMTTALEGRLHGMTVSAFSSLSLVPLLVLVCVEKLTVMHDMVSRSAVFSVSILGEADEGLARFFADNQRLVVPELPIAESSVGRPAAAMWRRTRCASCPEARPRCTAKSQAITMPRATASPCSSRSLKLSTTAAITPSWSAGWSSWRSGADRRPWSSIGAATPAFA